MIVIQEEYDIYGNEGLENGIIDSKGNFIGGYKFSGNAHEIFERFMGTGPFTLVQDIKKEEKSTTEASNYNIEEGKKKKEEEEKKNLKI